MPRSNKIEDPQRIGPFKILRVLGEGGMGVVYEAQQTDPVRRRVALKLVKLGMDTKQVVARFEAERQALAVMDHPNIAKVLDAGATEQGRPYFVMELVEGVPLTEYCDAQRLSLEDRLRLFIPMCRAVQHAHQKGILHRDLKPSNVLIGVKDRQPVPKIIDFGIAKAMGMSLTDRTLLTQRGEWIGTPDHMSPEQAEIGAADVDTRTDIYSIGVMLYEILVGVRPFDTEDVPRGATPIVAHHRRTPTPSSRLDTLGSRLGTITDRRQTTSAALRRDLSGDLDWIVMRAIQKDRTLRYETPIGLAADIQRYLSSEPVLARPPSARYRLAKFVQRNRMPVAAAGAALLALVLGAGAAVVGLLQAQRAGELARAEATAAVQVSDFMVGLFGTVNPREARGRDILVRDVLDDGARRIRSELGAQPLVQARMMLAMGHAYREMNLFDEAEPLLRQSLDLRQNELGPDHSDVAESLNGLGILLKETDRLDEGLAMQRQALEIFENTFGPESVEAAKVAFNIAGDASEFSEREALFRRALSVFESVPGQDEPVAGLSGTMTPRQVVAYILISMSRLYQDANRRGEAEPLLVDGLAMAEEVFPPGHPFLAWGYFRSGWFREREDPVFADSLYDVSLQHYTMVYGADHPDLVYPLWGRGRIAQQAGESSAAIPWLEAALAIKESHFDPGDSEAGAIRLLLSQILQAVDRRSEAQELWDRAVDRAWADDDPLAVAEILFGRSLQGRGPDIGFVAQAGDALDAVPSADSSRRYAQLLTQIGRQEFNLGDREAGLGHFEHGVILLEKTVAESESVGFGGLAFSLAELARYYEQEGREDDHRETLEKVVSLARSAEAAAETTDDLLEVGQLFQVADRPTDAIAAYRRALERADSSVSIEARAEILMPLASLYTAEDRPNEAETTFRQGIALCDSPEEDDREALASRAPFLCWGLVEGLAGMFQELGRQADADSVRSQHADLIEGASRFRLQPSDEPDGR